MRWATGMLMAIAAVAGIAAIATLHPSTRTEPPTAARPEPRSPARSIALSLAEILERNFVSPETGRRYAARLRERAAAGAYDRLPDRERLAAVLTADLQAVAPDGHLHVFARFPPPKDPPPPGAPPAIEEARWLAPGIAYLRPTVFSGSTAELEAVRRFLAAHASARTLIVDLRVSQGGGLAEMDEIFSAVFARPTRLAILETRAGANPVPFGAGPHLRAVSSPAGTVRLEHWALPEPPDTGLRRASVYVLTSRYTVSAGEHFCFVLKRTGRGTLVGETTVGAGNYGGLRRIGGDMAVFVPVGRTFDPDTGQGWEGRGISPDISVPTDRALVEALMRAGVAAREAQRLSDAVEPRGLRLLRAADLRRRHRA